MARQIIESPPELPSWLQGLGVPTVQRMLAWEAAQAQDCLADVFGYHALQAGWSGVEALAHNRMPHRWRAGLEFDGLAPEPGLSFDSRAWPWPAESLDLVVLPHTLERSADAHACLREVERVLIPEGQLFITGINPWSFWGWRQRRSRQRLSASGHPDWPVQMIAPHRLRDWLHLLGFEIQLQRFAAIHDQHPIDALLPSSRLDQQGHDEYQIAAARAFGFALCLLSDQRVEDSFQLPLRGRIGEHPLAHGLPVHGAVRTDHGRAELLGNRGDRSPALGRDAARDGVGVDHRCPQLGQHAGHGAFAAADAAREADAPKM